MVEKLTTEKLRYICRTQFETGIPIFRNTYKSPEQLEHTILSLRNLMLNQDVSRKEYIAVLRTLPGRFTAPDEISWYLGFGDVLLRTDDNIMGKSSTVISTGDFLRRLETGTLYQREGEFSTYSASRFLLNSYILLSHPEVLVTHSEVEQNGGVYGIWDKKFPSQGIIEPVSEKVLYSNYGRMNAGEVMESFLGMVSGREAGLPSAIKKDLNDRLKD